MTARTSRKQALLARLARTARRRYGLIVWQWLPGHVGGHATHSLHFQTFPGSKVGRAFDAYGRRMGAYALWLRVRHRKQLTECIYNGRVVRVSIKNGRHVDPSYWGTETWQAHRNHVHVGI